MKNKKGNILLLVILLGLLTFSTASYVGVKYFKEKKAKKVLNQKTSQNQNPTSTPSTFVTPSAEPTSPKTPTSNLLPTKEEKSETDWLTYKNYLNKFLINYPKEAKIEKRDEADIIENSNCVRIYTQNYYVLIGGANEENYDCFRTGVGANYAQGPTETVNIGGGEYKVTGMHTESASAGYYEEFFAVPTVDKRVRFEFGISVNEKYGSIKKAEAKAILAKILKSYSPAE